MNKWKLRPRHIYDKGKLAITLWPDPKWWTFGIYSPDYATVIDLGIVQFIFRKEKSL
jgi:hypothetical protein